MSAAMKIEITPGTNGHRWVSLVCESCDHRVSAMIDGPPEGRDIGDAFMRAAVLEAHDHASGCTSPE